MKAHTQRSGAREASAGPNPLSSAPAGGPVEIRLQAPRIAVVRDRAAARAGDAGRHLRDLVGRLHAGVLLLERDATVRYANGAASAILERRDPLVLLNGRLAARDTTVSARLRALVCDAPAGGRPAAVVLPSPAARWSLIAHICARAGHGPVAAVLVDPGAPPRIDSAHLRDLFGLTGAEARLAVLLLEGLPPAQSARRLGISVHTVRSQLRELFAKTGTRRQSELVRVLLMHGRPFS